MVRLDPPADSPRRRGRRLAFQDRGQLVDLRARAGDESELFQRVGEEGSDVLLAVGQAGAGRSFR